MTKNSLGGRLEIHVYMNSASDTLDAVTQTTEQIVLQTLLRHLQRMCYTDHYEFVFNSPTSSEIEYRKNSLP